MHRNRNEMSRMIELAAMIIIETSAINRSDDVCKKKCFCLLEFDGHAIHHSLTLLHTFITHISKQVSRSV